MTQINDGASHHSASRAVQIWLYFVAALVLLMVGVGGVTRLTDSGLSITTWRPIAGMVPPLSLADWQAEFAAYKLIPEYSQVNLGMSLEEFKGIFWWEWGHRFLGRFIGLCFALPLVFFVVTRQISTRLIPQLVVLLILGGLQGVLGWWMVSSGLSERVDVSQYRLAAHLCAAALLFAALLWVARGVRFNQGTLHNETPPRRGWVVGLIWWIVLTQIVAGAFVAGLHAGLSHNTWPLMDGSIVPNGLLSETPKWKNLFENVLTVQFNHRVIAYLLAALVLMHFISASSSASTHFKRWAAVLCLLIFAQIILGITTLLMFVPLLLASSHQIVAFLILATTTLYARDISLRNKGIIIP